MNLPSTVLSIVEFLKIYKSWNRIQTKLCQKPLLKHVYEYVIIMKYFFKDSFLRYFTKTSKCKMQFSIWKTERYLTFVYKNFMKLFCFQTSFLSSKLVIDFKTDKFDSQFCENEEKSDSLTYEKGLHFVNCEPLIRSLKYLKNMVHQK